MAGENEVILRIAGDEADGARALQAIQAAMKVTGQTATVISQQQVKAAGDVARAYTGVGAALTRAFAGADQQIAKASGATKVAADLASRYNADLGKVGREGMAALVAASDKYGVSLKEVASQQGVATTSLSRFRQEQDDARKASDAAAGAVIKAAAEQKRAQEDAAATAKRAAAEQVKAQEAVAAAAKKAQGDLVQAQTRFRDAAQAATQQAGRALTAGLTLPIAAAVASSVKAASDFESGFANVKKTLGDVSKDAATNTRFFDGLALSIRGIAKEIPQTTEQLSKIAALGGQFGISAQGIVGFTRTVADLGVAIDGIQIETAAEDLAQIRNITRESEADISRMASALVHLGNNGASSEAQILELTKRIAGAGHEVGLTTPQIMGIAAAVANVGVNAEAGGTAISRTFTQMSAAVDTGGEKLEAFTKIAREGNSALIKDSEDFKRVFKTNAAEAFQAFIQGLQNSKEAGANLTLLMKEFGAEGVRQADTLRRTSTAAGDLATQIRLADEAWIANNKHTQEAQTKYATFANQLVLFWNQLKDVGIELGTAILPVLRQVLDASKPVVEAVGDMARAFAELPEPARLALLAIAGGAASVGPLLLVAGQAASAARGIRELATAYRELKTAQAGAALADAALGVGAVSNATGTLSGRLSTLLPMLGRAGLVGGIAAVGAGSVIAATQVEDRWTKALVGSLNPLSGLIVSLRDAREGWAKLASDLAGNPVFERVRAGAVEAHRILGDVATVIGFLKDRAIEMALAFGRDAATAIATFGRDTLFHTRNAAAVVIDVLTPGLKELVAWLGRVAEKVPGLGEVIEGTKRIADTIGFDLRDALGRAALVATGSLIPGLAGVATQVPNVSTWALWRDKLAAAADIVRELEAMQARMAKMLPPPMFSRDQPGGSLYAQQAFGVDFERMLADTVPEAAIRGQAKIQQSIAETARLAKQYAEDMAKAGKAAFAKAAEEHKTYGLSVKEAAAANGIAETSLARYIAELKNIPKAAKAAKDALGGIDFKGDQKKAIETARELATQVKALGGVAKLTKDQQEALNKAMHAADAAMRAQQRSGDPLAQTFRVLAAQTEDWAKALPKAVNGVEMLVAASKKVDQKDVNLLNELLYGDLGTETSKVKVGLPDGIGQKVKGIDGDILKAHKTTLDWADSIGGVASAFADLAEISGRGLEGMEGQIAQVIGLMATGAQIGKQFRETFSRRDSDGKIITGTGAGLDFSALNGSQGTGNAIAAYANMAQTAVAGYGSLKAATGSRSRGKNVASGMATGASIGGSIVPGYGHLIGAGVGAIVGAARGGSLRDITARVKRNFAQTEISEDLSKQIRQDADDLFQKDRATAEIYNTGNILAEAGGVKASNAHVFSARTRDAFSGLETGKMNVEQTRKVVDENFGQLAAFYDKTGRVIDKSMRDIIRLNKEMKVESASVQEFVTKQANTLATGVGAMFGPLLKDVGGLSDKIADAKTRMDEARGDGGRELGVDDQRALTEATAEYNGLLAQQQSTVAKSGDEVQRLSRLTLAAFNAGTKNGLEYDDVLEANAGNLLALNQLEKDLGITIENSAVKALMAEQALVEQHRERVEAARTLNETTVAFANLNEMSAATYADLQSQGLATYASLQEAGFSQESILRRMAPFLMTIRDLQAEHNFTIDDGTQKLIDQASAADLLGGKSKDAAQVMKEGFETTNIGIAALIETLGGKVPAALQTLKDKSAAATGDMKGGMDRVKGSADAVRDATLRIGDAVREAAERGSGHWRTIIDDADAAARAVDGVSFGHSPGGLKEIAPMLRLAEQQMRTFSRGSVATLNDLQRVVDNFGWVGAPGADGSRFVGTNGVAGDTFILQGDVNASAIDTAGLRELIEAPDGVGMLLLQAWRTNRRGMQTAAKEILGV